MALDVWIVDKQGSPVGKTTVHVSEETFPDLREAARSIGAAVLATHVRTFYGADGDFWLDGGSTRSAAGEFKAIASTYARWTSVAGRDTALRLASLCTHAAKRGLQVRAFAD